MEKRTPKHVPTNFRLSFPARALLDALMIHLGVSSRTAVMERAIRALAIQEGVTIDPDPVSTDTISPQEP
jgi:hypothetical protein